MDKGVWKEAVRKDANEEGVGPRNRCEGRFVLQKRKVYPLLREEREEIREFVKEQLQKGYIWPSML